MLETFFTNWGWLMTPFINALIGAFVIPFLVQLAKLLKIKNIKRFVKTVVGSAEQLFGSNTGDNKKSYAADKIASKYKKLNKQEIDDYIENAVKDMKLQNGEYSNQTKIQKQNVKKYNEEKTHRESKRIIK